MKGLCENMEPVSYNSDSRLKRDLQAAALTGAFAGAIDVGFQMFNQKSLMNYPSERVRFEQQISKDTLNLSENKAKRTGFIGKMLNSVSEFNLKLKEDKLAAVKNNKFAFKSLGKGFAENVVIWGGISLILSAIINAFTRKDED